MTGPSIPGPASPDASERWRVKHVAADFDVSECPSVTRSAAGTHRLLRLRKQGYTTFEAIHVVADRLGLRSVDVHYAGLKDEDGVTEQLLSCATTLVGDLGDGFHVVDGERWIDLEDAGLAEEEIRVGELVGNVFRVVVRDLSDTLAEALAAAARRDVFFLNYYDTQRFGTPDGPKETHRLGGALLRGDHDEALELVRRSRAPEAAAATAWTGSAEAFFADLDPRTVAFYLSSYESDRWNQELIGLVTGTGALLRPRRRDGYDYVLPREPHAAVEVAARAPMLAYRRHRWAGEEAGVVASDSHRTTVVQTRVRCTAPRPDELFPGRQAVTLRFFLPSGTYATMAIEHLLVYALGGREDG